MPALFVLVAAVSSAFATCPAPACPDKAPACAYSKAPADWSALRACACADALVELKHLISKGSTDLLVSVAADNGVNRLLGKVAGAMAQKADGAQPPLCRRYDASQDKLSFARQESGRWVAEMKQQLGSFQKNEMPAALAKLPRPLAVNSLADTPANSAAGAPRTPGAGTAASLAAAGSASLSLSGLNHPLALTDSSGGPLTIGPAELPPGMRLRSPNAIDFSQPAPAGNGRSVFDGTSVDDRPPQPLTPQSALTWLRGARDDTAAFLQDHGMGWVNSGTGRVITAFETFPKLGTALVTDAGAAGAGAVGELEKQAGQGWNPELVRAGSYTSETAADLFTGTNREIGRTVGNFARSVTFQPLLPQTGPTALDRMLDESSRFGESYGGAAGAFLQANATVSKVTTNAAGSAVGALGLDKALKAGGWVANGETVGAGKTVDRMATLEGRVNLVNGALEQKPDPLGDNAASAASVATAEHPRIKIPLGRK